MRVVHVNDLAFVGTTLVRTMKTLGLDAELVEPWRPGTGLAYPWKLAALPFRAAAIGSSGLRLRVSAPDIVHVHYARLGVLGPLSGRPYVIHCHGTDIRGVRPRSWWGREVAPFLAGARAVYYATPDLEPDVRQFRPDAVFLPNPIDVPPEPVDGRDPTFDVLVGGRLAAIKGIDTIAQIVRRLMTLRPQTTVTILGLGADVRVVAAAAGDRVRIVPPIPHEAVPNVIRDHRVFLGQFRVGSLGNFELEALAAGRPVAAAFRYPDAYDAPPPVVGGHPDAVASRIRDLLDDDPARVALGAKGRDWVAGRHDPLTIAGRLVHDYERILASRPRVALRR